MICENTLLFSGNNSSPTNIPAVTDQGDSQIDKITGLPTHHTMSLSTPLEKSNYLEKAQAYSLAYNSDDLPINMDVGANPEISCFYYPVLHKNNQTITNREYGFKMNLSQSGRINMVDASFESGAAIYLYREDISYFDSTNLRMTRVLRSEDGKLFQRKDHQSFWHSLEGNPSEIKSARLVGCLEQGTLSVEVDSFRGNHTIITNRLVHGRWIHAESIPINNLGK